MLDKEQWVLTVKIDDVVNPIRTNSGASYRLGLELEAAIKITDKFSVRPNLTLSSNKNKETIVSRDGGIVNLGKTDISFSPEIIAANAIVFQPKENFQISLLSKYVGDQFMSNTESEVSKFDSYFINDFNIKYELKFLQKQDQNVGELTKQSFYSNRKMFFKSILFSGLVNNIFNVKYVSNGYYFTYDDDFSVPGTVTTVEGTGYYPQATINFLVGVTLKF